MENLLNFDKLDILRYQLSAVNNSIVYINPHFAYYLWIFLSIISQINDYKIHGVGE